MKILSKLCIKSAPWLTLGLAFMSVSTLRAGGTINGSPTITPQTNLILGEIAFSVTLVNDAPNISSWHVIVQDMDFVDALNVSVSVGDAGTAAYKATNLFAAGSPFQILVTQTDTFNNTVIVASLSAIDVIFVEDPIFSCSDAIGDCDGYGNGVLNVTVLGGFPPFTVDIYGPTSDSQTSSYTDFTFTNLEAGTYTVTVTDYDGFAQDTCEILGSVSASPQGPLSVCELSSPLLLTGLPVSANGAFGTWSTDGNIYALSDNENGTATFDPSFDTVNSTVTLTYELQTCTTDVEILIVPDPVITIDYGSAQSPYCCDDTNDVNLTATDTVYGGQWSISPTPGAGGFAPDNNAATAVFNPAAAGPGSYDITFSNEVGYCLDTITLVVLECLEVIVESRCATCFGFDDGEVEVTVTGGLPPYTINFGGYNFDDQVVSQYGNEIFGGLIAGDYTVAVIDSNGCTSYPESFEAVVGEPSELVISAADSVTCLSDELVALTAITSVYGCSELEAGGVWTGAGVEYDDGAGNAFFNPGVAGAGTHTLRFTANSNGYGECFDELDITVYPDLLVETAQELEACRDDEFCYNITITNPNAQPPLSGDSGFITVTGLLDPAWSVTQVIDCTTVEDSYNNQGGGLWTNPLDVAITLQTAGTGTWTIGVLEPGGSICLKLCGTDPNVGNKTLDIKVSQTIPY